MTPLLLNLTQELYTSEETSEFFLDFFIDAFLAAIIRWLTKEPIAPAELFLNRMRDVLIGLAKITMKELADNPEDEKSIHLS